MTPEQAKTIADFLLSTLDNEIPLTTGVLGAVPDGALDYRPDGVSKTALELVRHITLEDEWMLVGVANGAFGPMPDQTDTCGLMTPADAVATYTDRIPRAAARIRTMSGDELARTVDFLGVFQLPAVEFLSLMIRHSAHHRGQLSAYLRAMGGKVPAIYGPSADTQMAVV